MISRRNALKLLGCIIVCSAGTAMAKDDEVVTSDFMISDEQFEITGPTSFIFESDGIKNVVIERKGKKDITIPFSDIVKALEGEYGGDK